MHGVVGRYLLDYKRVECVRERSFSWKDFMISRNSCIKRVYYITTCL